MTRTGIAALARLDAHEVLRSRWPAVVTVIYAALAALLTFAAMRESSVLEFTGTGRVLLSFAHALLLLLPLLALGSTSQTLNRAREDGTLELLFGQPVLPSDYYAAVTLTRCALLFVPFAALVATLPLLTWAAFADPIPWAYLGRTLLIGLALIWSFVGLGLALSASVVNQAKAAVMALLGWASAVALVDFALIALLLQWRLNAASVFVLAALNPVQCARMALLSGQDPELSIFGPVGFFLAHKVGSAGLLALGVGWPLVVGTAAWWFGLRRFRSGDLV